MEKNISLELTQVELRMLYKCLSYCTRVEFQYQHNHPDIIDDLSYGYFYDDLNDLYFRICDLYQDSCHLFGEVVSDY